MILRHNDDIITHEGMFLTYQPPIISPEVECLIHVIQESVRPTTINLAHFSFVTLPAGDPKSISFPAVVGFVAFAFAVNIPLRVRWFVDPLNNGEIGGTWEENNPWWERELLDPLNREGFLFTSFMNLWPDPELFVHNDILYRVYWTSYQTKFTQRVDLWAT